MAFGTVVSIFYTFVLQMLKIMQGNLSGVRHRINFRFIIMLAVVFLIQQLSFAAIHGVFFSADNNYTSLHYKENLPEKQGSSHVSMDIEVEVAEEDEVQGQHDQPDCSLATQYIIGRQFYTSFINSLYLHLERANHGQADRPLFVLHHSWKAHLS